MNNRSVQIINKPSNKEKASMKHNNFVTNEEKTSTSQTIEKLKDFCGYTTAHGLGRLVESKGYVRKVFWVMACLGAFSMFASQVISLAQQYVSRPVETYISMKYVRDIDFPVVTICNLNAIRRSKIYANDSLISDKYLRSLLNGSSKGDDSDDRGSSVKRESRQIRETNLTTVMPITTSKKKNKQKNKEEKKNDKEEEKKEEKKKAKEEKKEKKKQDKKKEREEKKKKEKEEEEEKVVEYVARQERLSVALATMPEDKLSTLGHQFNDMFRECTYRGKSCLKSGLWDSFWHYKYGNCYSFNKVRGLTAGGPGPSYGLLLEINVEQNEYASDLTKDAGIRVQIENPGKVPFPYEKGFSVGPGSATSVGMRKVKIKRVDPFKDGSCMEEERREHKNLFLLKHNATYSITACRESCLSDKQKERCGCREYRFPKDASKNESVCDTSNAAVAKCLKGVMKKYRKSNLGCSRQCASPCNEDVYKLTISTSKFPSLSYQTILRQDKELTKRNISVDDLGSYLLQLNVFFEELNYEIIEEHMSYGFVSFISDIGGNVGMWIGVSVLTCAELLELLCIIIHHAIKKCAQRGTKIQSIN